MLWFSEDTVSFAACSQASTLSNFLWRGYYQMCTCLRCRLSRFAQGRPSILPREVLRSDWLCSLPFHMLPWELLDITSCQISPALDILCFQLSLSRQIIFNLNVWPLFYPPHLSRHQKLVHFTTESMELTWICKFRDAIVDQFLSQHLFSSIPENWMPWLLKIDFF